MHKSPPDFYRSARVTRSPRCALLTTPGREKPADTVRLGDRTVPRRMRVEIGIGLEGPPADGGPVVRLWLEVVGDRPQCREVQIVSQPWQTGGREVRQGDLESLCLSAWVERVFALAALPSFATQDDWRAAQPGLRKAVAAARRGRGDRKVTREFLAEVAAVYRRNVADRPTQTVADAFGIAHSTAAEYVRRARAAGLLPATTSGKRKA